MKYFNIIITLLFCGVIFCQREKTEKLKWGIDWQFYDSIDSSVIDIPLEYRIIQDTYFPVEIIDDSLSKEGCLSAILLCDKAEDYEEFVLFHSYLKVKLINNNILLFNKSFDWEDLFTGDNDINIDTFYLDLTKHPY